MFILTVSWPDWIEHVFGVDPDHHSGSFEAGVSAAFLVVTLSLATRRRLRRLVSWVIAAGRASQEA